MATFQELTSNIETLENETYSKFFDVEKFMISNEEAAKKLLKSIHPELTEENLNDVIDSAESAEAKIEEEEKKAEEAEEKIQEEREKYEDAQDDDEPEQTREQKRQQRQEERAKRKEKRKVKREERKKKRKEMSKQMKDIYKQKKEQLTKQVKEIKKRIKETVHKLFVQWIDLIQKLAAGIVNSVNSLVAAITICVAPPFNVPSAICLLISVLFSF